MERPPPAAPSERHGAVVQGAMAAEADRIVREALEALTEDHREVITLEATLQLLGRALVQFGLEPRRRGGQPRRGEGA